MTCCQSWISLGQPSSLGTPETWESSSTLAFPPLYQVTADRTRCWVSYQPSSSSSLVSWLGLPHLLYFRQLGSPRGCQRNLLNTQILLYLTTWWSLMLMIKIKMLNMFYKALQGLTSAFLWPSCHRLCVLWSYWPACIPWSCPAGHPDTWLMPSYPSDLTSNPLA